MCHDNMMQWNVPQFENDAGPGFNLLRQLLIGDPEDRMVRTAGLEPAFPFEKQIFVPPRLSPPPHRRSWSGLSLRQGLPTVGATRLVSTPSPGGAWLGIGLG